MRKNLFSSRAIAAFAVVGAMAAVPAAASADTSSGSTTIFATAQGTSVLGTDLPVVGTQGFDVTLPVSSSTLPQAVWNAIDFTITGSISLGETQLANVYVDPKMVR